MAADRSQSPAYQALTPAARKVLAMIGGKIADGGGVATISLTNLAKLCGVSNSTAFLAQRQIVALGFVSIAPGPRPRDSYRLADGWRAHDAVEAMRLRKVARTSKPRTPKPVKPRTKRRRCRVCRGTMRGSGTPVCGGTNARAKKGPEYGETIGALQGGEDSAAAPEARQQIRMHRSRCMRVDMDQTMRRGTIRSAVLP